jgi:hypothetical protein
MLKNIILSSEAYYLIIKLRLSFEYIYHMDIVLVLLGVPHHLRELIYSFIQISFCVQHQISIITGNIIGLKKT